MMQAKTLATTVAIHLVGSVTCDILITISMASALFRARRWTKRSSTKRLLNALIVNSIENGMITTVFALADLVCFYVYPDTFLHACM